MLYPMALRIEGERSTRRSEYKFRFGWVLRCSENTAASKDEDPATLTHQGKPAARWQQQHLHKNGIWMIDPNYCKKHGKIAKTQNLQTRIDPSPYGHYNRKVRNHLYGVDKNRTALRLQASVACWPKSYFRTEVPKFMEF